MSGMSRRTGPITPRVIVNRESVGGQMLNNFAPMGAAVFLYTPAKVINSGAMAANTFTPILNIAGGGVLSFLRVMVNDPTTRNLSVRVTLDGVVVFYATSAPCSTSNNYMEIVGSTFLGQSSVPCLSLDAIPFSKSMLVEVASNIAESAATISVLTVYRTN
jgi:hypothetical protein